MANATTPDPSATETVTPRVKKSVKYYEPLLAAPLPTTIKDARNMAKELADASDMAGNQAVLAEDLAKVRREQQAKFDAKATEVFGHAASLMNSTPK